jgi:hypothetical protein
MKQHNCTLSFTSVTAGSASFSFVVESRNRKINSTVLSHQILPALAVLFSLNDAFKSLQGYDKLRFSWSRNTTVRSRWKGHSCLTGIRGDELAKRTTQSCFVVMNNISNEYQFQKNTNVQPGSLIQIKWNGTTVPTEQFKSPNVHKWIQLQSSTLLCALQTEPSGFISRLGYRLSWGFSLVFLSLSRQIPEVL